MAVRLAVRTTGKKVKVFLTSAGSVEAGRRLARSPAAQRAQACMTGNSTKGARVACLKGLKKGA